MQSRNRKIRSYVFFYDLLQFQFVHVFWVWHEVGNRLLFLRVLCHLSGGDVNHVSGEALAGGRDTAQSLFPP